MKIGNIKLENNLILAPLHGVNCNAFRLQCKKHGAALVYTPLIHPESLIHEDEKIDIIKEERPIAAQLVGKDPELMAEGARILSEHADIIDINLGCPDQKVLQKQCGAFFSKHPEQMEKMVKAVIDSTNLPVTAKIRIGWDDKSINAVDVAKRLEILGVDMIAVHGRTRKQVYMGKANWDVIKQVKESVLIPVVGNGDVFSAQDYVKMFDKTGVDAVMIGRGAMGNPLIFENCLRLKEGKELIEKDLTIVRKLFDEFIDLYKKYSPRETFSEIRTHAMWMVKGIKKSKEFRNKLMNTKNILEIKEILEKN